MLFCKLCNLLLVVSFFIAFLSEQVHATVMLASLLPFVQALQHVLIPMFTVTCEEGRGDEVSGIHNVVV